MTDPNEIFIKTADTLDESVATLRLRINKIIKGTVPKYSLFGIPIGKKKVENTISEDKVYQIRPATLRTMVRISRELLFIEVDEMPEDKDYLQWAFKVIADNTALQAKVIAIAIHNDKLEVPNDLVETILDNFNATDLANVTKIVIDKMDIAPFINSIGSMKSFQILKTEVSPIEEKTENQVSGAQSEVLSNILGSATIMP